MSGTKNTRLLLVDDQGFIRAGLKSFLQSQEGFEVVAEAGNREEAIKQARMSHPDIILMDVTVPDLGGIETIRQLCTLCPDCRILALSARENRHQFLLALSAGVFGYIIKQAAADDLMAAIRTVAAGHIYLQPAQACWLLDNYQRLVCQSGSPFPVRVENADGTANGLETLSLRERHVLELVAQGLNNPEIGSRLELSPKTIARHRERIMNKLNMHSRTELVKIAIRSGLVKLS